MAKLPSRNHLHNHCVFYVLVIDLLKYVLSYNVIIFVPKTGTCNGIFKFNFLALVQWRRQDFFSGGARSLSPFLPFLLPPSLSPTFPFSSLPFLPLLSRPSQAGSQDCQNEEADRSSAPPLPYPPLPCPHLPFPALPCPSRHSSSKTFDTLCIKRIRIGLL